jgi:uncharacterized protein YndB with AHSA1/START domain
MAKDLVITRTFDAPVEKVWKAWTTPAGIMSWWGPKDFTSPTCKIDFQVGGKYVFSMHGAFEPGGEEADMYSTGTYKEIVPQSRLAFTDSFSDSEGNVVPPTEYGMPDSFPRELEVVLEFKEVGGKTEMTLTHRGIPETKEGELTEAGWKESFEKLADSLK